MYLHLSVAGACLLRPILLLWPLRVHVLNARVMVGEISRMTGLLYQPHRPCAGQTLVPAMNFFYKTFESAQEYTRQAAATASTSAQELAQQVSSRTATLATQAGQASSAAAEQATERFRGLQLTEALQKQLNALQQNTQNREGSAPSKEQLEAYGISSDFQSFVRSLTYSTFRDFPQEPADARSSAEVQQHKDGRYLTSWQEQHALLVVQAVTEINELRFVLCPKRMTDKQFWHTYFHLARKHLPPEAFDPHFQPKQPPTAAAEQPVDFQTRLQQLSASAQHWGTSTAASVAALAGKSSGADSQSLNAAGAKADSSGSEMHAREGQQADGLAADSDLEAYLQVQLLVPGGSVLCLPVSESCVPGSAISKHITSLDADRQSQQTEHLATCNFYLQDAMGREGEDAPGEEYAGSTDTSEGDDDFDQYLRELNAGEDGAGAQEAQSNPRDGQSNGASTPDTLDEYVKDLQ